MRKIFVPLLVLVALVSLAANALLYMRYSTSRPLMRIGSETITKKEFQDSLEYQAGKQVLTKLALTKLVLQAAAKAGVTPTDKDVETRLAEIERTQPALLAAANQDPGKMAELKQGLKTDLAVENLRIKDVKVSDAELAAFYNRNKAAFALPAQTKAEIVYAKNEVDQASAAKLLSDKLRPDQILSSLPGKVGVAGLNWNPNWSVLPRSENAKLSRTIFGMGKGDVKKVTLQAGKDKLYLALRVNDKKSASVPSLAQNKERVERVAKLQKAKLSPQAMLAKLYQDAAPTFEVERYAGYFDDLKKQVKQTADSR